MDLFTTCRVNWTGNLLSNTILQNYVMQNGNPLAAFTVLKEGQNSSALEEAFAA